MATEQPGSELDTKLSLCLTKHHAMKTYRGSGVVAPLIRKGKGKGKIAPVLLFN